MLDSFIIDRIRRDRERERERRRERAQLPPPPPPPPPKENPDREVPDPGFVIVDFEVR